MGVLCTFFRQRFVTPLASIPPTIALIYPGKHKE